MAAGTSSLPEVAGDAALLVDPHDAIAIADALYWLLAEPDLRAELRRRGLERAELFTWRRTAAQVAALLNFLPLRS